MMSGRKTIIKTAVAAAVMLAGFAFAHSASAAYFKTGSLVSTNLLDGLTNVGAITQFNATTSIVASTSVSVQFSRNKITWYNASGTAFATSSLSNGVNSLDLSALGWNGPIFYYKLQFATNVSSTTPTVSGVAVNYNQSAGPTYAYFSQGSLVSANMLDGHTDVGAITGFSATTTVPASTTLSVQFSRDQITWYNASGTAFATSSLSNGSNVINLSALNWTGPLIYYKLRFTTSDVGQTASISAAEIDYSAGSGSTYFKQGTMVSTNLLAGTSSTFSGTGMHFVYTITSLPSGTSIQAQFSANGTSSWYNSSGTLWGWNTLSAGNHMEAETSIDLSGLGWSTSTAFYYKLQFTSADSALTPLISKAGIGVAISSVKVRGRGTVSSSTPSVKLRGGGARYQTPAFVQSAYGTAWGTSAAAAFASNVTAGNVIAVMTTWGPDKTLNSVTDSQGNIYTIVDNPTTGGNGGNIQAAMAYAVVGSSAANTVTATVSATTRVDIIVHEISGVNTTAPLDNNLHQMNVQTQPGSGTDAVTSGNITTTVNGDYIFGAVGDDQGSKPNTAGTGYTSRQVGTDMLKLSEDKIQTSAGQIAATFTTDSSYMVTITGIMAFKAALVTTPSVKFR